MLYVYKNSYLKKLYNQYNKKYFGGKLPDIVVGWATTEQFVEHRIAKRTCAFTSLDQEKPTRPTAIVIHRSENKSMLHVKTDLLHEMVHVAHMRADHGPVFKAEIRRLVNEGAYDGIL